MWQLAWAHPVYGSVLATCGYDRKVILWKEQDSGWTKIYEYSNHDSSGTVVGNWHVGISKVSGKKFLSTNGLSTVSFDTFSEFSTNVTTRGHSLKLMK